jgi:hypothetical protein
MIGAIADSVLVHHGMGNMITGVLLPIEIAAPWYMVV